MKVRTLARTVLDSAIFGAAVFGTYIAQLAERPITAVLIFLTGVIVIAFRSGVVSALIAATTASLIYNFFLSGPAFRFGIASADEAVPLIAFNVSAVLAAIMVGRLKDSARKAYEAQSETAFMLTVSDRLQSAVKVEEVETALRGVIPRQGVMSVEIFLTKGKAYWRPSTGAVEFDTLKPLLDEDELRPAGQAKLAIIELNGARGSLGFVKFRLTDGILDRHASSKLQSIATMVSLAVERCLLLEELAEARARMRSEALKDALLSSVSHDLRTPITVIQAAAGALRSAEFNLPEEERGRLLSAILEQCGRLDRYTAELLDVGQIQSGIAEDRLEPVNLAEITGLAIKNARAAHPGVEVERLMSGENHFVRANATMLEQAIYNLIDNAQKFGGEAGPVTVALESDPTTATIVITDHGPGIFEEERERVFTRFFKGKRNGGKAGMGLGLFIAKGFVEAFGGSITIESPLDADRGTRIVVTLPVLKANTGMIAA
ncbi:ATP-binding protein [Erythrobacter sp. sf7]|uniref:histidine kinase n=1 Tax=Erythrobacter fulvus TaxID=2987523 RepID=A0ABT5JPN7_9SPHN|nr:ATP-binding protein [Erythrobacter fulvus]MDC8754748.1 ATP-binding protein [Erythrobacter fulvus]